jgi:hypothetical protein
MSRAIMQQALDMIDKLTWALETHLYIKAPHDAKPLMKALRQALTQPKQKKTASMRMHEAGYTRRWKGLEKDADEQAPVAWLYRGHLHQFDPSDWATEPACPLYKIPPCKEWVGLTDEERNEMIGKIQHDQYTRQRDLIGKTQIITEMYLKERNT